MLGDKGIYRILPWGKCGTVDKPPQAPFPKDERILHLRHFLVEADLVLVGLFAAHKTPFIG
jgi:hypothetical protein